MYKIRWFRGFEQELWLLKVTWSRFVSPPLMKVTARHSDNIDASGLPDSSSESWRPEDSENVVVFEIWRFWTGVMAAQSHLIQIRVPPKSCFWGSFLQKMASHGQTVHFWLYSVIHRWKALDLSFLMYFWKKDFFDPTKWQIFRDASGQFFSLLLRPCLTKLVGVCPRARTY